MVEDGDYFGEPVVQAARLCNAADGGSILVAEVVRLSAPRGHHRFDRLGPVELKGIPEAVDVARLQWSPLKPAAESAVPLPDRLTVTSPVPYIGRSSEREQIDDVLKAATSGLRQVLLLSGEAGQGKTRLATEVARSAHDDGALVLYGRCDDQLPVPYGPWAQALRHWARHSEDAERRSTGPGPELLLPELLGSPSESGGPTLSDQHALYSSLTALLLELSDDQPVLVVLDDLHWADRDSLLLLRHVAGNLLTGRVMLLGTYRDTDLSDGNPLDELLAALRRETGVTRIALDGLAPRRFGRWCRCRCPTRNRTTTSSGCSPTRPAGTRSSSANCCGISRNRGLDLDGILDPSLGAGNSSPLTLPQSVREVVTARVDALGEPAVRTLTAAAIIGHEFEVELLTELVDLGPDEVIEVIDTAVDTGILNEVDHSGARLSFAHALVRRVLTETLSKRRRVLIHRSITKALERHEAAGSGTTSAAQLALHWEAAQFPDGRDRLLGLLLAAGRDARDRRAPEEAIAWFTRALELVDAEGEQECELLVLLGESERQAGHPEHRDHLLRAAHVARRLGRDDLIMASALINHRGFQSGAGMVDEERIEVLRWALDVVPTSSTDHARSLVQLAMELPTDDPTRLDLASGAVAAARASGDTATLVDVIALALTVLVAPEHFDRAAALSAEAMAMTDAGVDPARRMQVLFGEQGVQLIRGDIDAAARCSAEYEELVERLGQPVRRWTVALRGAIQSTLIGDYAAAQNRIDATLELGLATGQPDAFVSYGALVMGLAIHKGGTRELIPLVLEASEQNPGLPILRAGAASFLAEAGRVDEAATVVATLGDLERVLPHDHFLLATAVLLTDAVERMADRDTATVLHRILEPYAQRIAVHPAGCLGAVSFSLGRLGAILGRDDARAFMEDSLERHERLRSPYYRARFAPGARDLGPLAPRPRHRAGCPAWLQRHRPRHRCATGTQTSPRGLSPLRRRPRPTPPPASVRPGPTACGWRSRGSPGAALGTREPTARAPARRCPW